ncbi:MAG: Crp/Fnr family transcriptional regulator [Chromatiaceae bacterium]|nr:Crp/Fnr family transcriptional regulator [Gammaproteobacteria bacterium]MCP5305118.1 Crp/Fnr family transcriptional regulator [Chromatiaceae bacterium]MCP5315077.1 Crp/Fnr family transcriptional regulator [Chromatiaceae bacterium]
MLNNVALFSSLSPQELQALESHAKSKRYRKNTVIMEKGDESAALYVLVSGKVRVYVADDEGKEVVLNVCDEPGSHFGELALLRNTTRTASVMTMEDSEFQIISKTDFLKCVTDNPQIALDIISDLVDQVTNLTDRVSALALNDVYGRLAATLRDLAREEDGRMITQALTQQELAQMIGASREMVSRIFKELKAGDYISLEDKRIVLNKKLPARW